MPTYGYARVLDYRPGPYPTTYWMLKAAGCDVIRAEKAEPHAHAAAEPNSKSCSTFSSRGTPSCSPGLIVWRAAFETFRTSSTNSRPARRRAQGHRAADRHPHRRRQGLPRRARCVFAEFETNLRRERQLEGIAAAKAKQAPRKAASGQSMKPGSAGYDHKAWDPPRSPVSWGSAVPPSIGLGLMADGGRRRIRGRGAGHPPPPARRLVGADPERRRMLESPPSSTACPARRSIGACASTFGRSPSAAPTAAARASCPPPRWSELRDRRRDEDPHHQPEGPPSLDRPGPRVVGGARGRHPGRPEAAGPDTHHRQPHLSALAYDHARMTRAAGGPLPGGAVERALALRHEPVGPEAAEGAAVDRAGAGHADPDAVFRCR